MVLGTFNHHISALGKTSVPDFLAVSRKVGHESSLGSLARGPAPNLNPKSFFQEIQEILGLDRAQAIRFDWGTWAWAIGAKA